MATKVHAQTTGSATLASSDTVQSILQEEESTAIEEDEEDEETSTRDSSTLRTISDNKWKKIKEDKSFVYKKTKPEKKEKKEHKESYKAPDFNWVGNLFNAGIFKVLMFLIVGFVLIMVIYHLFLSGENGFLNRREKPVDTGHSFEHADVFSDWDMALHKALEKNDLRLAIRVLYLQTLHILHEHEWIFFEQEKTNYEYVKQLSGRDKQEAFIVLTSYFDYIWYGSFSIDRERYNSIEQLFRNFQGEII